MSMNIFVNGTYVVIILFNLILFYPEVIIHYFPIRSLKNCKKNWHTSKNNEKKLIWKTSIKIKCSKFKWQDK